MTGNRKKTGSDDRIAEIEFAVKRVIRETAIQERGRISPVISPPRFSKNKSLEKDD